MSPKLKKYLAHAKIFVERGLEKYLPSEKQDPYSIHKSMRYSVFAGGKKIRPVLSLLSYELFGGNRKDEKILVTCCALEMLHVFSLIHDDLPCMDDDNFRRGKPTNHRVFGEAIAVLAGDALCIHAFELLAKTKNCRIAADISKALGTGGMIGGQVKDIESEGKKANRKILEYIHTHKTAALITTSLRCGALLAKASENNLNRITRFGEKIGLVFQIADDILDVVGTTKQLGKDAHSDEVLKKVTYPSVLGLARSKKIACELTEKAKKDLKPFGNKAEFLREIADYIIERIN